MSKRNWLLNNILSRNLFYLIYHYKRIPLLYNLNIRKKLIIGFLSISILPLIAAGLIQYFVFLKTLPPKFGESIFQILEQTDLNISNDIIVLRQQLNSLQLNKELIEALDIKDNMSQNETIYRIYDLRNLISYYGDYNSGHSVSLYVNWKDQNPALFNDSMVFLLQTSLEMQWYQEAITGYKDVQWKGVHRQKNEFSSYEVVSGYKAIRNINNQPLGIVEINEDIQRFKNIVKDIRIGHTGFVILLDSDNQLIAASNSLNSGNTAVIKEVTEKIAIHQGESVFDAKINSTPSLVVYKRNTITGWLLAAIVPMEDTLESAVVFGSTTLVIILACIIGAIALALPLSYGISNPVRKLISVMRNAQDHDFNVSVTPLSKDEIGEMCEYFNLMMKRIRELVEKVYKVELEKKEEELKALQAQINPHFLYNTLDTINWLSACEGNKDIGIMARSLANFFRYSLSKGNSIIPVADEIELAKNYLSIQKIRLRDKLEVEYDFSEEIYSYSIVKLVLQPILENSIVHSTKKALNKLNIHVSGKLCGNSLVFSVTDNGPGVDPAIIDELLSSKDKKIRKGYGVRNVNDRIQLYCGSQYGLTYYRMECGGTRVEIRTSLILNDKERFND